MTYDANGSALSDGTNTYVWDARNRLVSADNNSANFTYDPLGRRVAKTVMSTTTSFLYDGANAVQEFGTNPTANLLTGGVDERFQRTSSTETDDYLTDALGSTVELTGASGATEEQYIYSPYGSQSASGMTTTNSYAYTGREFDGLGVDYYRARYYNPTTGRFLSEDPMGFAGSGANLYAYAKNNPISNKDPLGLCSCKGGNSGNSDMDQISAMGEGLDYLKYAMTMNWILPLMFLFVGFAIFISGFFLIFPELLFAEAVFFGGALIIGTGELTMLLGVIYGAMGLQFALTPPGPRLMPSECQ